MFKFGPYTLDEEAVRLSKHDQSVQLEPQVFNTLLLLVKNRHRVVSKDELLEEIWNNRPVTDYVITRIIYELRKVLDEGGDSAIRTVRSKGYQFNIPVEVLVVSEAGSNKSIDVKAPSKQPFWLLCTVFIFSVGFFSWLWWPNQDSHPEEATPITSDLPAKKFPKIAVLPIISDSNEGDLGMLTYALLEYLVNELAVGLRMRVIHPDSLKTFKTDAKDINKIQQSTAADFLVQGVLEEVSGEDMRIHFDLYKKSEDQGLELFSLGSFELFLPESGQALNDLYKKRKETAKEIIKIIKPGVEFNDETVSETQNPDVYRLVIAAHHTSRKDDCEGLKAAEKLLLQAKSLDPNYAYTYHRLFVNYYKRVWYCGSSKSWHRKALQMAEKVEELAPNKYYTLAIARHAMLVESNQVETAYEFEINDSYDDPNAQNREIYALRFAGFLQLAKSKMEKLLQVDPYFYSQKPVQQSPNTLMYLGLYEEFLALLTTPGNAYHDYYRGMAYYLMKREDEARNVLTSVVEKTPNDLFGSFSQAMLYIMDNDFESAIAKVQEISDHRDLQEHTDGEVTYKQAQIFASAGDQKSALKYFKQATEQGFFAVQYFNSDPMMQSLHQTDAFQAIVDTAKVRHLAFAQRFGLEAEISQNSDH